MNAQSETNLSPWGCREIESGRDVTAALAHLNLPSLSEDAIRLIAQSNERGKFKRALQDCVNGGNVSADTKRYLTGLVRCLSSVAMQAMESLGLEDVPLEVIFHIGKTNGMAFRNALDAAVNKNSPNSANGASLVAASIREACDHLGLRQVSGVLNAAVPVVQNTEEAGELLPSCDPDSEDEGGRGCKSRNEYLSTHVYGGKAALCFNAAKSRDDKHFTVVVDGAEAKGERNYDWSNSVSIQLGHKEIPLLFGVLVGWRQSVKFDAHGPANDKVFEIERQDGKFFAKVMGKINKQAVARAVPIGSADALPMMELAFAQIVKEAPKELQGSPDLIFKMMQAAQNIKPLKPIVAQD